MSRLRDDLERVLGADAITKITFHDGFMIVSKRTGHQRLRRTVEAIESLAIALIEDDAEREARIKEVAERGGFKYIPPEKRIHNLPGKK